MPFEKVGADGQVSRRSFLRGCAVTAAAMSLPVLDSWAESRWVGKNRRAAQRVLSLNQDWLFGGKFTAAAREPGFDDSTFSRVTLPHCVAPLSWRNWDPTAWENVWIYRRHFDAPKDFRGLRTFLHFDRVMEGATPFVNGHALPEHPGGFLPFEHEITDLLQTKNVLAVSVDGRWLNVPPSGSPRGPKSVDYLLPGGISGAVSVRAVPSIFIRDVFAKPVKVLDPDRRVDVACTLDAGHLRAANARVEAVLADGAREIARASESVTLEAPEQTVKLTLANLGDIALWSPESPKLYDVVVTLFVDDKPLHDYRTRIGFREASFEVDGFFLNGRKFVLFGLDRHELYPYMGFSAPDRVLARDAEILRREFNCNMVRCSHYPQSEAFMDACDDLGLMAWEEVPGWQYVGDESFRKLLLCDVAGMVRRDRNHPSVVIWGVRINESPNEPKLYERTRAIAKSLDDSRPTSGTMTPTSMKTWKTEWHQDVFAFDDYEAEPNGSVKIMPPLPGVPYLVTEAVGQYDYGGKGFDRKYRRAGDAVIQQQQALLHAQAHSRAANYTRCAGLIAWCAFDYASLMNAWETVKCPGVADFFRIPKLGASFYRAQVEASARPVIEPDFAWDFNAQAPDGPGERAAIFSNCDRLELFIDGKAHGTVYPDRAGYPHVISPPFFANLKIGGAKTPELRIDGYLNGVKAVSRSFSSNHSFDQLLLKADDAELRGDGSDATRMMFGVADKFGSLRTAGVGEVKLRLSGPGRIVGDNPFSIDMTGAVGAVWIQALPDRTGRIRVEASHSALGRKTVVIEVIA